MDEVKIEICNLTKKYKELLALNDVSLTLTSGIYGLLGPNGAGKSTFMNTLAGLLKPSSGDVKYNGESVYKNKQYQQKIGYMPQQQCGYEQFSGYRFLSYIAALKGISNKSIHNEVISVATLVKLENRLNDKLKNYSGGMKQRIMIAAALLGDPKIILLDEPTAGLDPKIRIEIRNMISELSRDKIIIIATHVVQDVEFIAKDIIVLKKGELVGMGTPLSLVKQLDGVIYETTMPSDVFEGFKKRYMICNLVYADDGVTVRFISDKKDSEINTFTAVTANLEDYYLYVFEGE